MTPEQLKASILQYAIQGKLVEQRAEEGTGEELFQEIERKREVLIKEEIIKKDKRTNSIINFQEVPFDIPENWMWVTLGSILNKLTDGTHKTPKYTSTGVKFVSVKDMLNGHFENCYGLKRFNLPNINFSRCNKALIYAPNGVMKSSLSKVFDDISKGSATSDRIFQNVISSYSVTHYTSQYVFSSANATQLPATDKVYVVNTFNNSFEFTKETVSTLLADETTRKVRRHISFCQS